MSPPNRVEVAVVGAGPAGSTLASALAMRGRDVALFERDTFPRDKVCGEFLSPEAAACFDELGCREAFHRLSPSEMGRTRISVSGHDPVELALPATGYGLSRRRLDEFLFQYGKTRGVQAFEGANVRRVDSQKGGKKQLGIAFECDGERREQVVEADLVVGAYGRRSRIDRKLKRPFFQTRSPYVAFKRHHRIFRDGGGPPLRDFVELHAFDGGYCGVSYVEDDVVNCCTMFERRLLDSGQISRRAPFRSLAASSDTALSRRLASLEPCDDKLCAVAQIPLSAKKVTRQGVLFVGDAATMIAPLAGDGQAMAMESALALAEFIDRHLPRVSRRRWAALWRARYELRIRLGRWLQRAIIRPRIAGLALQVLRRFPTVGRGLVALTRG